MKRLIFIGPAGHVLHEGDDQLEPGAEFETTDARAVDLLSDPNFVVGLAPHDYTQMNREQLNDLASKAGIDGPEKLPNKDAVVEALNAQPEREPAPTETIPPPPAADTGEGLSDLPLEDN